MPNPGFIGAIKDTLINGSICGVIVATTIPSSIGLNPNQVYSLAHDGEDPNGNSATQTIYLSTSGQSALMSTTFDSGYDKIKLKNGRPLAIGPNFNILNFATASGIACFSIIPGASIN